MKMKVGRKPNKNTGSHVNISESELELLQKLSTASTKPTPERGGYFTPHRAFRLEVADGNDIVAHHGNLKINFAGLALVCYRKIQCSNEKCLKWKWAHEFHWNRQGIEGPFKELWGKRDCWCKVCRLKQKSRKRRERFNKIDRRKGRNTVDMTQFTVIENFEPRDSDEQRRAYRDILDRVFFRMTDA